MNKTKGIEKKKKVEEAVVIEQMKFSEALSMVDVDKNKLKQERFLEAATILYLSDSISVAEYDEILSAKTATDIKKIIDRIEKSKQERRS